MRKSKTTTAMPKLIHFANMRAFLISLFARIAVALLVIFSPQTFAGESKSLTKDSAVRNLTLVDGIDRFERKYFLRNASIGIYAWIDNRRILAGVNNSVAHQGRPVLEHNKKTSVWVVIDTETGTIERPWSDATKVECFNNGRIVLSEPLSDDWQGPKAWHVGQFGRPLTTYTVEVGYKGLPKEWADNQLIFDRTSCKLVKQLKNIRGEVWPEWYRGGTVTYLEPGHGWLIEEKWHRVAGTTGEYMLVKEDGTKIPIPITVGEKRFGPPQYLAFADGYFVHPELSYSDPQHVWSAHSTRLIHPDGRIEQFPVPEPIMDRIIAKEFSAFVRYTRRGSLWAISVSDRRKQDADRLMGDYLVIGNELVRVAQHVRAISPDGCKLAANSGYTRQQIQQMWRLSLDNKDNHITQDYFFINLCKE